MHRAVGILSLVLLAACREPLQSDDPVLDACYRLCEAYNRDSDCDEDQVICGHTCREVRADLAPECLDAARESWRCAAAQQWACDDGDRLTPPTADLSMCREEEAAYDACDRAHAQ